MIDPISERTPRPWLTTRHVYRSLTYGVDLQESYKLSKVNRADIQKTSASSEPAETFLELEALLGRASQMRKKISRDFSWS
jgi:hypothetical protein